MGEPQDAPIAIAAGTDGSIWFTIDHADAIGRVRNGRIERLPTSGRNIEPLGLAVAADGSAWYTDLAARAIAHISSAGEIARFVLDTPIARLGRLAIAPDGAVWFADQTGYGITRLKDGVFTRHRDRVRARRTLRGRSDGRRRRMGDAAERQPAAPARGRRDTAGHSTFRVPAQSRLTSRSAPTARCGFCSSAPIASGDFKDGQFSDVEVGRENAGLSGIAVAPNDDVWFGMMRRASLGRLRNGQHRDLCASPRQCPAVQRRGRSRWQCLVRRHQRICRHAAGQACGCAVGSAVDLKFLWYSRQSSAGWCELRNRDQPDI